MDKNDFNSSYIGQRPDIEELVTSNVKRVLDVGCSTGVLGAAIKKKTGAQVFGVELSESMANEALKRIDKVFVGNAEDIMIHGKLDGFKFDIIIFADVLEHLVDPWAVLNEAKSHLNENGTIIASIPNIRHVSTIYNLVVKGYWPYRERGIHDKTHLRFFTKRNVIELFKDSGFVIEVIKPNYRFVEAGHYLDQYAKWFAIPGVKNFITFQYLIRAHLA